GGTIADRPVREQIMRLIETHSIKGVLVVDPQRLSRGDLEDCGRIINAFRYTNTLILTPPRTYNLQDEYDRKFFEMELTRGNDYLEYTKKILYRGRVASVKQGNFIGSVPPYGYKKVRCGSGKDTYHTLEIVPDEADAVRLMYHLFADEGYGFARIAHKLDSLGIKPRKAKYWSPAAIKDMLENPVYTGKIRWDWRKTNKKLVDGKIVKERPKTKNETDMTLVDGKHDSIIDLSLYEKALSKRGKCVRIRSGNELVNPFAGLLYCSTCGHAMVYKSYANKKQSGSICQSLLCNNQSNCHTKSVQYQAFCERLIQSLENSIADFEVRLKSDNGTAARINLNIIHNLEADLKKLHQKDLRQKDAFDDGIYTKEEYLSRNAKVQEQIAKTQIALDDARHAITPIVDYREKIAQFQDCVYAMRDASLTAANKNSFLKSCIERITYHNNMESKAGIGRYVENQFELEIVLK
ncbi:MAG: recombinase family protein, partial [Roseburia sp.]